MNVCLFHKTAMLNSFNLYKDEEVQVHVYKINMIYRHTIYVGKAAVKITERSISYKVRNIL